MSFFKKIFGQKKDTPQNTGEESFYDFINIAESSAEYSRYDEACLYYEKAYKIYPHRKSELYRWAITLFLLFKQKRDNEKITDINLLDQVIAKFESFDNLDILDADFYNEWAKAINERYYIDYDNSKYFDTAFHLYAKAIEISPKRADILNSWAHDLGILASEEDSAELYVQSIEKYAEAASVYISTKDSALNKLNSHLDWAKAVLGLATLKNDISLIDEASDIYAQLLILFDFDKDLKLHIYIEWIDTISAAISNMKATEQISKHLLIFERAIADIPDNAEIYSSCAYAEGLFAILEDSDSLFENSYKKFATASLLSPDYAIVYNYWGRILLLEAELTSNESTYLEGFEKLEQAYNLGFEEDTFIAFWGYELLIYAADYNKLAEYENKIDFIFSKSNDYGLESVAFYCAYVYAKLGDTDKALHWLEIHLQSYYPADFREYIETIPEFDDLRKDKRFKELLDRFCPK